MAKINQLFADSIDKSRPWTPMRIMMTLLALPAAAVLAVVLPLLLVSSLVCGAAISCISALTGAAPFAMRLNFGVRSE